MTSQSFQASMDTITPLQQMVASCSGALLTSFFVTPLDVIKIRLQAQKSPLSKGKCFVYCNGLMDHICVCENGNTKAWYKPRGHFNGTVDAFIKIVRMEGIRSLWSGLPPTLVMAVPATVIYFTAYDQLCAALRLRMGETADLAPLLAGSTARVFSATLISPIELIRTKLQSERQSYRELSAVIRSAVHTEGWLALWRGLGPTLLRDVPFSGKIFRKQSKMALKRSRLTFLRILCAKQRGNPMYWYNYEKGKAWLCHYNKTTEPTFSITFISGAVSGSIASIVTLPFDVVKTRRQVELGELQARKLSPGVSSSTYNVMKRIVAENGVRGLFAGFMPRLIKVAPACAIMISSYEFGKAFFRKQNKENRPVLRLHSTNT